MQTQTKNDQKSALDFAKALYGINKEASTNNQVGAINNDKSKKIDDVSDIGGCINFPKTNASNEDIKKFKAQIGKYIMYVACGFASKELGKHRLGSNKGVRQNFRHFSDENFAGDLKNLVMPKYCGITLCPRRPSTYDFFNVSKICWSKGRAEADVINENLSELARKVVDYCNDDVNINSVNIKEKTETILAKAMDCCKAISTKCNEMSGKGTDLIPLYGYVNPAWRLTMGHGGRYFKKGVDKLFGKMGVRCCTWNSFSHDQSKYDKAFKSLSDAAKPQQTELK